MATETFTDDAFPLAAYGGGKQLMQVHSEAGSHLGSPGHSTTLGDPLGDANGTRLVVDDANQRATLNVDQVFDADSAQCGPVIKSPNGTKYRVIVANGGGVSTVAV